jgi:hypothetical protein
MKKIVILLFITSTVLFSCDNYQQSPVSPDYVSSLNAAISDGQHNGATWVNSPVGIAKHFFPSVSHNGKSKQYGIHITNKSATDCMVIVTDEGAINDEVSGERRTMHLHANNDQWSIADLKYEVKRRD